MLLHVIVLSLFTKALGQVTEHHTSRVYISQEITSLKEKIYSAGLLEEVNSNNEIGCARSCSSSHGCLSFFYNKNNKTCQMHGGTLNITTDDQYSASPGYRYYKMKRGLVGHPCVTSVGCTTANSECGTAGVCRCVAGYSFHSGTKTCETDCSRYGNTFELFQSRAIKDNNEESFTDVTTLEECCQLCISAIGYTCISADWELSTAKCWLQSVDALDMPGYYVIDPPNTYVQRNCA